MLRSRMRASEVKVLLLSGALLVAMVALAVTSYLLNTAGTTTRPVEAVSVEGPVPPYIPAGPTVSITLKNTGKILATELTAALAIPRAGPTNDPFPFPFNVTL